MAALVLLSCGERFIKYDGAAEEDVAVDVVDLGAPVLKVIEEKDEDREKHGDGDRQAHHQAGVNHLPKISIFLKIHEMIITERKPTKQKRLTRH